MTKAKRLVVLWLRCVVRVGIVKIYILGDGRPALNQCRDKAREC